MAGNDPTNIGPLGIEYSTIFHEMVPKFDLLVEEIGNRTINNMFSNILISKVIKVTGLMPYDDEDLESLFFLLGAFLVRDEYEWAELDFIVIGKEEFDEEYLEYSIGELPPNVYYSQEDFLNYILFGHLANYHMDDARIEEHPGLSFLASIGFKWPSIYSTPGDEPLEDTSAWLEQSELMRRYGYSVKEGTSKWDRQARLTKAIEDPNGLSLRYVANHIASLLRNAKRRNDNLMDRAITEVRQFDT